MSRVKETFFKFNLKRASTLTTLIAILCVASASALQNTASTTISTAVSEVISISTSGTVNINTTPSASGSQSISNDTVQVSTNDPAGYILELNETSSSATSLTTGANTIAASSGTQASPVVMAANTWGYRVDGVGGFGAGPTSAVSSAAIGTLTFAAVPPSTPATLASTASASNGTSLNVWYGVAVNDSTVAGTYTNSVTYTAVAN